MIQDNPDDEIVETSFSVERIINKEFAAGFLEEIKCPICYQVLFNPKICRNCEKAFCQECITQLKGKKNCPCCRSFLELKPAPKILTNLISKLIVECIYKNKGCNKNINCDSLEKHQNLECDYISVRCYNIPCEEIIFKKDLLTHKNICLYESIQCPDCKITLKRYELENHQLYTCDHRKVLCKYCEQTLIFCEQQEHEKQCPNRFKTCKWCNTQYTYENYQLHTKIKCMKKQKNYYKRKYKEEFSRTLLLEGKINNSNEEIAKIQEQIDSLKQGGQNIKRVSFW